MEEQALVLDVEPMDAKASEPGKSNA